MKVKYILFFRIFIFFAIFFLDCKKDPDTKTERLLLYQLLCPQGSEVCYNDCASSTGISDGSITGTEYKNFQSCTFLCDSFCNLSFLLVTKD